MEKLVYIGKVIDIQPIPKADLIEALTVVCGHGGKWQGVARKGDFLVGDACEVYLQDCLLPHTERFAFMERHGWRIRMMRFKMAPSECLIMPQTLPGQVGEDITWMAQVERYSKPIPACLGGIAVGNFPSFIPKTDEPNYQSVTELVEFLRGQRYSVTEKADGASATVYWRAGHLGCCSRNLELKETENQTIWKIARQYHLDKYLQDKELALQFEVVGPGIQGNPMGLKNPEPRLFDVWDIEARDYWSHWRVLELAEELGFPTVAMVQSDNRPFDLDGEALRRLAEGLYPNGKQREGIVVRPQVEQRVNGTRLSFKVLNLLYKESV